MSGARTSGVPYRTTTDEVDAFYREAKDPLEMDEEGIEMSSAGIEAARKKGKGVVSRLQTDEEEGGGFPPCICGAVLRVCSRALFPFTSHSLVTRSRPTLQAQLGEKLSGKGERALCP